MRVRVVVLIQLIMLVHPAWAELSLIKGVPHRDTSGFTNVFRNKAWDLEDIAYKAGYAEIDSIVSYVPDDSTGIYYVLDRDIMIGIINETEQTVRGAWSLTRWAHLQRPLEVLENHAVIGVSSWKENIEYTSHRPYSGCFNKAPLRYGDIENDGKNEIVLFLNGEFIVFSPARQRTVFSAFIQADDWFREPMDGISRESDVAEGEAYQYLSEHLLYNGISHKAHRSYTKLYMADFDEDGNSDILTWQKVYASNKVGEQVGFRLIRETLTHYERDLEAQEVSSQGITGEYLPQKTDAATIQQWLADNQLTWQKGYPDVSECPGEEGNPIPEMSDPLLNDPDVLM